MKTLEELAAFVESCTDGLSDEGCAELAAELRALAALRASGGGFQPVSKPPTKGDDLVGDLILKWNPTVAQPRVYHFGFYCNRKWQVHGLPSCHVLGSDLFSKEIRTPDEWSYIPGTAPATAREAPDTERLQAQLFTARTALARIYWHPYRKQHDRMNLLEAEWWARDGLEATGGVQSWAEFEAAIRAALSDKGLPHD